MQIQAKICGILYDNGENWVLSLSRLLKKKVDKRNHDTNKKKMKIEICKTDKNAVVKLF